MADILEKIAKTEGNENEISLGELEKHFDEITKDKENDDNQIGKLIKAFEKNIDKNSEKFLNPKDIIKEILDKDSFSIIKYTPNLIKVYQLCKRLEDKQERKIDGELPQEMIKDWVTEKQKNAGTFSSESIYYDDQQQNLVIKTPFGEYTQPFQESEKGTVKVNNMDKTIPDISYIPGILSDFFTIIDSEENMKKIIKEQRVILFDAFIQANSNPDKEGTDVEDISLSEDGVMTVEIGNDDVEIYIKETKNISKMTSEEVLEYIHEKRTDFKDDKNVRNAENAQLNAMIDQKVFSDTDMDFINTWCKDKNHKEQQPKKIAKIQDTMNGRIDDMMSQKITPKLVNAGNADVYDSSDIKMIQLRANICFDENLLLDGNRGALFYSGNNTENQKITNMYIYRNELKTRSESMDIRKLSNKVVFDKLLDLPNLDALLQNLGDNDIQNKVFGQFLKFFLEVRVAGQYFENLIGSERLESVLVCMINAELLKNTSPSEYFADIDIQKIQQANAEKKLNKDSVEYLLLQMREIIEKGKFETMGKYYEYIYTTSTNEIIAINKNNTTNNNIKAIANEITKLEGELKGLDKEEKYQPAPTVLTLTEADKQQITIDRQNINRIKLPDQLTITPESNRIETPWGKKKIEIIEKKLQIYEINKNSDYLFNVIYMDIKGSFSEQDIKQLFSMKRITKYGVSHQDYLSKTAKLTEDLDKKLEEKQPVIDVMSQFEAEGEVTITRPTWDEFEKAFGSKNQLGTYPYEAWKSAVYNENKFTERNKYVPYDVYALKIPGINKVIVRDGGDVLGGAFGFTTSMFPKPNTIEYPKPRGVHSTNTIEYSEMKGFQGYKMIVLNDLNGKTITYKDFNIAKKNTQGELEIYNFATKSTRETNPTKKISVLEQESANEVQNIAMGNVYDRELREINKSFETFDKDFSPMMEILNDFQQKGENDDGIDSKQRDELKYSADDFLRNKLYKYEQSIDSWKEQVKRLETMKSSGTLKNTFEENVNVQISTLNEMINLFSVTDGTSPIKGILTAMTEVSENDDGYEKVWVWLKDHGIQTLIAIAGAVAAIVLAAPSGGTSVWAYIQGMTLFSAAVGTLGGMVGSRIGQAMNEGIRNCPLWDNEINGRVYEYDNPTDVELWLTNKMSSADFFTGLGTEFLIGTITTFGFMKAGQIIGNAIAKSGIINNVGNLRPSVQVGKLIDFGKKIIFRNVNSVANNSMETFAKAFTREVSEETFEESIENVGKNINPILGGIITMLNCLSGPSAGKIFQDHNVAGGKTDIVGNQIIQEMTYRAENISQLEKYFIDQEYKKIISENGEIQYVKPMETAETIYKPDGSTKVLNEHVIKLKYSNAGTFVNNSAEFFAKYGMEVNHDVENEVTVDDPKKIQAFKVAVGMGNMGVVTINPDGSAKFTTGKNTIHIKVVTENVITTNTSITETQVNPTLSTETVNNVNDVIEEVEDNQNMLENDIDTEQMIEQEKITLVNKVQIKIFNLVRSLSGKTEADVLHDIGTYMFNNVKHFLHECKHVFGTQLVDVYKSYIQMKKYSGKPGDAEYQKVFQAKVKERGINLTKLVGVSALAKLGIDPHLVFWSGHLIADQLQKHIPFFDKLFGLSFETMNTLYSRKKGKNTMYNPQTVIENSLLDPDTRRQKIAEELGLDASDAKNTPLLNALQEAHEVGQDGPGKNAEYSPGVYNYTTAQIRQKMEILKPFIENGSITLEQVRMLFERGYLGKNAVKVDVVEESNNENIEHGVFDESDIEMMGNNQQLLTNELAQTNPTRYQEILIEKLSTNPTYKGILDAMEKNGTKIIVNPSLATRGGYDKKTNTIEINPTRENRNDGSLWGDGGYGTLSGDQLTLAVVGHEMHHFLFENTLQPNRNASYEVIKGGYKKFYGIYETIITNIHNMIKNGKSFVYHTNTQSGIDAYRSQIEKDSKGDQMFDGEGNPILDKELNDYLVAEENVIELSRLYSQGQLDGYLQYLVDTEQSILDEKGLQKITADEKAEIFMYIEVLVDGAKNELNIDQDVVLDTKNVDVINTPTTDNIEEIIAAEKEKLEKFMEENEFDETDPEQKKEKEKHEKTLESYQKALELITNVKTKYSKKLLDIEEKLKLDPTNKKLLTEKEKYQKIQSVLENEVNINKKMTVIDTIKAKLNITKMNINKLWIKLKGAVSGDKINIQNKIDGLTEKTKKLQLELDAHEKDIQSIFEETYQGIRDMKGLTDQEMLELGKIYNEYILKPIGFRIIDFSATFGTDVLLDKNGNTLGIDTEIANAAERSNAGLDLVSIAEMKLALYGITENATIDEVDSKVENMLENVKNPAEKEVLSKLRASMKSKVNDGRLLPSEKAVIFAHTIAFVGDYKLAFKDKTASDVLLLVEANQNKLMHQHVQDKSYLTGSSHNILHILKGNMDMAENFMQNMSPMERVLARQIIIDHDIGYTSMFNKYLNESLKKGNFKYFDATKDHPIRSTLYIEENSGWYEHNFGKKEYNIIKNGILSHSSPKTTSLPSKRYSGEVRPDIIYGVTSVVDCAAASADYKTAFLFGQPEIVTQFKLVYEAMAQGDISTAEKSFVKIVEIINASDIDIELKTALLNAVDSMHLKPDADGSIPFQKKLNELKNMTAEEIIQEKNSMLKKAKKNNDPKNLKKVLESFNKANGTDYETIVQLEGVTDEQIKKYAMFDYIDGIVSFPYQKYLAQYGVRVAKTLNDVYEIGEEKGVIRVNFELSGKTFESLVKMGGVEFALSSFIKVCEDFNIDKNGLEMKKLIANIEKAITTGNMEKTLTQMYGDTRVELVGKNNESVNLNFRGESYGDIDQMIEMQTELNESINETTENMKNAFKELEINKELDQRKVLVADMKSYVADIVDVVGDKTYVVGGLTLPEYAIAIQNKLDTYFIIEGDISQDHIKEVLTDIDNIATAGYFPSLFTKIKG